MKKNLLLIIVSIFLCSCADKDELLTKDEWVLTSEWRLIFNSRPLPPSTPHALASEDQVLKFSKDGTLLIKEKNKPDVKSSWKWIQVESGRMDITIDKGTEFLKPGNYTITYLDSDDMRMQLLYNFESMADCFEYAKREK